MLRVKKLESSDVLNIIPQPSQRQFGERRTQELADGLAEGSDAISLLWEDNLILVGGLLKRHPGVGEFWSVISPEFSKHALPVTRMVSKLINMVESEGEYHRLQAYVELKFAAGHRWANMLGFRMEGVLQKFGADGSDYAIYARINNG